jgi:hypothetical protein
MGLPAISLTATPVKTLGAAKPLRSFSEVLRAAPAREAFAARPHFTNRITVTIEHVHRAQRSLDKVLALATSGKSFSPSQLLAFQAQVYRCSQELELAGKVVEKASSGLKQVLQTQL